MSHLRVAACFVFVSASSLHMPIVSAAAPSPIVESVAGRYAECAAYFRLVVYAVEASNKSELAASYRKVEDTSMFYSLLLASEGRARDIAIQVTNSRIELSMKQMKGEIDNRNENIAILMNKYGESCSAIVKDPPNEVRQALAKRLAASQKK